MARKLAVRTVVAWFGELSFEEQNSALAQFQDQHDQSRSAKRSELQKQLAALGYTPGKKRGRPRANANSGGNGREGRKGKVKAKYRDPKTNESWSAGAGWRAGSRASKTPVRKSRSTSSDRSLLTFVKSDCPRSKRGSLPMHAAGERWEGPLLLSQTACGRAS